MSEASTQQIGARLSEGPFWHCLETPSFATVGAILYVQRLSA